MHACTDPYMGGALLQELTSPSPMRRHRWPSHNGPYARLGPVRVCAHVAFRQPACTVRAIKEAGFMPSRLPLCHQAHRVLLQITVSYRCKQRLRAEEAPSRTRVVRIFCAKLTFDCVGLAAQ